MSNHTFLGLSILPALLVAACGGAHMTGYTPVNQKTKYSADQLYAAARLSVEALGLKLQTADGVEHTVDTREREVAISSIPRLSYRYSFHIETKGGILAIQARCQENSASKEGEYKDCGTDRPRQVIDEQDAIAKKTLELAPSQEDKSIDWSNYGKNLPEEPPPQEKAKAPAKSGKSGKK